jgi:hypothetical protein
VLKVAKGRSKRPAKYLRQQVQPDAEEEAESDEEEASPQTQGRFMSFAPVQNVWKAQAAKKRAAKGKGKKGGSKKAGGTKPKADSRSASGKSGRGVKQARRPAAAQAGTRTSARASKRARVGTAAEQNGARVSPVSEVVTSPSTDDAPPALVA